MSNVTQIRALMRAVTVIPSGCRLQGPSGESVEMQAVCGGGKNEEENSYARYTPSGSLKLEIDNPTAQGYFKPGRKYALTIEEVPEPPATGG